MFKLDYIIWNESFNTDIPAIDEQHKRIVRLINDIFPLLSTRVNPVEFRELAGRLRDYTRTHFAFEEKLLKDIGYPALPGHLAEHRKLTADTRALYARLPSQTDDAIRDMFQFVRNWWANHICHTDMDYARLYRMAKESNPSPEAPFSAP